MKVSRRYFMAGASALVLMLSPEAKAWVHGNGAALAGKVQAGINAMFSSIDLPFIDVTRTGPSTWQPNPTTPASDPYALFNADGYPNAFTSGSSQWRMVGLSGILQDPADGFSGRWVLDWTCAPGAVALCSANVSNLPNFTQSTVSGSTTVASQVGRIVYNVTSTTATPLTTVFNWQTNIFGITGQVTKIRLYPARYETILNAGQQWDPEFINFYKPYGRIRFMDWQGTNGACVQEWSQRTLPTMASQRGQNINTGVYCGQVTNTTKNDFTTLTAIPSNPSATSWVDGMMVQAYFTTFPSSVTIQSMSLAGNILTVQATAHGFTTGDQIQFANNAGGGSGSTAIGVLLNTFSPVYSITVTDADHFTVDGVNTTGLNTSGGGQCYYQIRVKAGSLPFKPCAFPDGNSLFGAGPLSVTHPVGMFIYDADFDRLLFNLGPDAQTGGSTGVSIETLVDLANTLGPQVQPWFCIPATASDDYMLQFSTYLLNNLNPSIKFCVSLSNEVWNLSFIQSSWFNGKGAKRWSISAYFNTEAQYSYFGYKFRRLMLVLEGVFSGQMSRVNRILDMRTIDDPSSIPTQVSWRAQCPREGYTAGNYPINHSDSICIAPYYNTERVSVTPGLDYTQISNVVYGNAGQITTGLAYLDGRMRNDTTGQGSLAYYQTLLPHWATYAASFGVKLTAYEGGFNLLSNSGISVTLTGTPYTPSSNNIVSGTYNNGTGAVDLILTAPYPFGFTNTNLIVAGLTGTGSVASLNGTFNTTGVDFPSSGHISFTAAPGLGAITITGGSCCQYQADVTRMYFAYWQSSVYAQFLTDATNLFFSVGGEFPAQYTVVDGSWSGGNPFKLKQPNRFGADIPAYTAWRTLNGR